MKKFIAIVAVLAMCLGLAACGSKKETEAPKESETAAPEQTETAAPATSAVKVAVSLPPAENAWQANFAEMLDKQLAESGLDYVLKSSTDAADQMNVIQTYLDDKSITFMVVLPVDGSQLTATVEAVYDSGMPVIVCDRDISSDKKTAFVAGDNYGCGVAAAEYVQEYFKDAEEVNFVNLRSYAGTEIDLSRWNGFYDIISKDPKFKQLGEADGEFNSTAGYEGMSNLLAAYDKIDLVYTHDDETTTGALSAIEGAKRTDIQLITGMGGTKTSLAEIKADNNAHKMTAAYFPADMAEVVIDAIKTYASTGSIESEILFKSYAITKDNVDTLSEKAYE